METLLDLLRRHELQVQAAMVDVLLESGLPEFKPEALGAKPEWHRLGEAEKFKEGSLPKEIERNR